MMGAVIDCYFTSRPSVRCHSRWAVHDACRIQCYCQQPTQIIDHYGITVIRRGVSSSYFHHGHSNKMLFWSFAVITRAGM
jgi:hypothetical protein